MTPGVSRWLATWASPMTDEDARARIARWQEAVRARRAFQRVIERRSDGAFVGWISISRSAEDPKRGTMGYWLVEECQGQGYMSEAATAAVAAAFDALDLEVVEAGAQP